MFKYLNPLRWKRSFLFLIILGFLIVWFGFIDSYSVLTRIKLNSEKEELSSKIEQMKKETAVLEKKIADLKENPDLLEKIAREQYGMRKKGEKVYRIVEK